ncbi:MAG: ABC transporter ATP-binding protein [Parvularculaceae bacterium]
MTLSLRNISRRFGDTVAVDDASLDVSPGEIVCLFGPSGCGKTTLLRLAAGLEPLEAGEVALDDMVLARPGAESPPEKRPVGFVFQDYVLFPHLTVAENVGFGLAGRAAAERRKAVAARLASVGLAALASRYPHQLSGGQQQRVALARALAREPKALLLDEPFASIDAALRQTLRDRMRRILKIDGVASILVTHDAEEALALGDRIAIMRAGNLIEIATPKALFEAPKTPDGASMFAGAQRLEGVAAGGAVKTAFAGVTPETPPPDGPVSVVALSGGVTARENEKGAARVVDIRFAGPGWTALVESVETGESLRAVCAGPVEPGGRVAVSFDPRCLRLFPDA